MAKAQAQEIAVLRAEVERLRMKTFPALVQLDWCYNLFIYLIVLAEWFFFIRLFINLITLIKTYILRQFVYFAFLPYAGYCYLDLCGFGD